MLQCNKTRRAVIAQEINYNYNKVGLQLPLYLVKSKACKKFSIVFKLCMMIPVTICYDLGSGPESQNMQIFLLFDNKFLLVIITITLRCFKQRILRIKS